MNKWIQMNNDLRFTFSLSLSGSVSLCLIKEQWFWSQEGVALVALPVEPELTLRIIIIQLDNKDIISQRAEKACKIVMA